MSVLDMRTALEVLQVRKVRVLVIVLVSVGVWCVQPTAVGALPEHELSTTTPHRDEDDSSDDADEVDLLPVRAVVLVDESGSLSEEDVKAEQDAVAIFADTVEDGWEVGIFPFGSSNGPGQNAVVRQCELVKVESEANRQRLRDCAQTIHRRDDGEGNDTDHAAALNEAVAALTKAEGEALPVIFLMTDGKLDVERSPQYGEAGRTEAALTGINGEILPRAKKNNVQVWPIGFGDVDQAALENLARGGAQVNSRCPEAAASVPQPVVKPGPTELALAFQQIAASAVCASSMGSVISVGAGESKEETHTISPVATSGVLSVVKSNSKSSVSFIDPDGKEVSTSGEDGPSTYERSGTDSNNEVLRIERPKPGDWKVKVTAAEGEQTFAVFSRWTGKVDTAVNVPTGTPSAGSESTATLRLKTYSEQDVPPEALKGFEFSGALSGESFDPLKFKLADDGKGVDTTAGDLLFSGTFTTPESCDGPATLKGSVNAPGLAGDVRNYEFNCTEGASPVAASITLTGLEKGGAVTVGSELSGKVSLDNRGEAFDGKLSIVDVSDGAQLSIDPSSVEVPDGTSEVEFSLAIDDDSKLGQTTFSIQLDGDDGPVTSSDQSLVVEEPPSIVPKVLALLLIVLVIAGAAALLVWRRRQAQQKARLVKGLQAFLIEDGEESRPVSAPGGKKDVFPVEVNEYAVRGAREADPDALMIRRHPQSPKTKVIVRKPDGEEVEVAIGQTFDLEEQSDGADSFGSGSNRRLKIIDKR